MTQHRTAKGKAFNMETFRLKNEQVRTVGNVKANARGDLIDAHGKVIKTRNQRTGENYDKSIGTRGARAQGVTGQSPNQVNKLVADHLSESIPDGMPESIPDRNLDLLPEEKELFEDTYVRDDVVVKKKKEASSSSRSTPSIQSTQPIDPLV